MSNGNDSNKEARWGCFSFARGFIPCPVLTLQQLARKRPVAAIENRIGMAARSRQQGDVEKAEALLTEAEKIFVFAAGPTPQASCGIA